MTAEGMREEEKEGEGQIMDEQCNDIEDILYIQVYAMDTSFPIVVAATADRSVFLFDLRHPGPFHELKRYISFFILLAFLLYFFYSLFFFIFFFFFFCLFIFLSLFSCMLFDHQYTSPLKYQSKSVALFPNKAGFALGSIEGR